MTLNSNSNNINYNYDEQAKIMLDRFITQLDSQSGKVDPDDVSADLKYTRSLQRERLNKKGASISLDYTHNLDKMFKGIAWKMDVDTRYVTRIPFHNVDARVGYSVHGKLKKEIHEKENIYAFALWLKGQKNSEIDADANYVCPHCGAPTVVRKLAEGCEFCGTRFLLNDLYPKITNYYTVATFSYARHVLPYVILGGILGPSITYLTNMDLFAQAFQSADILGIIQCIFYLAVAAAVGLAGGYILLAIATVGYVLLKSLISLPLILRYRRVRKHLPGFMRSFEPNFSIDHLLGKILYLTSMMVYSDNYDELSVYDGEPMKNSFDDIIDLRYGSLFDVKKYYVENGLVYLDVVVHMDDIHCKGSRIFRKKDKFNLLLCKSTSAEIDYGFTIHAVSCRSCGGWMEKRVYFTGMCPYCSSSDLTEQVVSGQRVYFINDNTNRKPDNPDYYKAPSLNAKRIAYAIGFGIALFFVFIFLIVFLNFVSNYNNDEYLRETLLSGRSYSSFELIRESLMNVIIFSAFGLVSVGSALVFTFVRMLSIENAQRYARRFAQIPTPFISISELAQISRANSPLGQSSGITPEWVYKKIVKSIKEGYLRGCSPEKHGGMLRIALAKQIVKDRCPGCGAPIVGAVTENYSCRYCGRIITGVIRKQ